MPNYGERLVYWYLRLQGFCLVENFVLHRRTIDDKDIHSADADLLAIRLSGSCEEIDGERLEPDPWLEQELQFDSRHVALIVQVLGNVVRRLLRNLMNAEDRDGR